MNKIDKAKVKVLIKFILINKFPDMMSARQLADNINLHDWGFRTSISSKDIGSLLSHELRKNDYHFLEKVKCSKGRGGVCKYYYEKFPP